jgi:hypothetical protein
MKRRKFLQLTSSVPLLATTPTVLGQITPTSTATASPKTASLNLSNQDSPTDEDQAQIKAVIAAIPEISADKIGDFYDTHIYPAAEVATKNALRSGNAQWKNLLIELWQASQSLSVEGTDDLVQQIVEREQALPKTGLAQFVFPDAIKKKLELFATPKAEELKPFDPGPNVNEAGCIMVLHTTQQFPSYRNFPVRYGILRVLENQQVIDQFRAQTGGSAIDFKTRGGPLPPGRYKIHNYRANRTDIPAMVVDGISYSFDVDPVDNTNVFNRSLFRIHPDGRAPGTMGCIGIVGDGKTQSRFEQLASAMVAKYGIFKLAMSHL